MDELRTRIIEDLAPLLEGEVKCDPLTVGLYATDGSLYQMPPLGVVFPRHADDVAAAVTYAAANRVSILARGAGTGLAGESLGCGLVIDFSRHMRQIEAIAGSTVRVQPGVVCGDLNRALKPHGRYFPPDPSGASVTTLGSMLALDAAGSHSVRVGSTKDHVQSLEVVLADGSRASVGETAWPAGPASSGPASSGTNGAPPLVFQQIVDRLGRLLEENAEVISRRQPPMARNRCGYQVRGVLEHGKLRLPRLLVGSEGTLALFTSATLYTAPLPAHRGAALLLYGQLEAALRGVQRACAHQPSACDLLDRRLLTLAREADPRFHALIPPAAEAALIIEQTGFTAPQTSQRLRSIIADLSAHGGNHALVHEALSEPEVEFLWSLPEKVVPLLARMQGLVRPLPFVEDVAVPPEALHDFLVRAHAVFQKHKVTASLYSHAAAGQVHLRPFLPPPQPETAALLAEIAGDLYEVVWSLGGTISGEHGSGFSRSGFVRGQYQELYAVFKQIKQLFDPHNILNPGKVLNDDAHLITRHLRPVPPERPAVDVELRWQPDELRQGVLRCNGCGHCRTREPELRMCPVFRAQPREEASPRAKANLMRMWLSGQIAADACSTPEFKQIADLCFNCKQCQLECPSNVNIPHLMLEAKAAYVAAHGMTRSEWALARAHTWGALGAGASGVFNWALANSAARYVIEKLFGISRLRKLPRFARRSFLRMAPRELLARPALERGARPVVYFVDHYANYHDPALARAFVSIMRHHGVSVHVPPGQWASGLALISAGDVEAARELALANVRALADLAREGCPIVCTEPSAAICLKQEYPRLLDHPDVQTVADRVIDAGAFLLRLRDEKRLRTDLAPLPISAGYHQPCHLKALECGTPLANLVGLIGGVNLHRIEEGCSGMAGAWGLSRDNFVNSLRIGWGLISRMRGADLSIGLTECSSCKMQMEQGTSTPTLHPLKLLALSYGLMPELKEKLKPSRNRLLVT